MTEILTNGMSATTPEVLSDSPEAQVLHRFVDVIERLTPPEDLDGPTVARRVRQFAIAPGSFDFPTDSVTVTNYHPMHPNRWRTADLTFTHHNQSLFGLRYILKPTDSLGKLYLHTGAANAEEFTDMTYVNQLLDKLEPLVPVDQQR